MPVFPLNCFQRARILGRSLVNHIMWYYKFKGILLPITLSMTLRCTWNDRNQHMEFNRAANVKN
jgi:hypothetical protein